MFIIRYVVRCVLSYDERSSQPREGKLKGFNNYNLNVVFYDAVSTQDYLGLKPTGKRVTCIFPGFVK